MAITKNILGENYILKKEDITRVLEGVYQMAVAVRGNAKDYHKLALIEIRVGDQLGEDSEALKHYELALGCMMKISQDKRPKDYNSIIAALYFKIWEWADDESGEEILQKAYFHANKELPKKLSNIQQHFVARILIEKADSEYRLNAEKCFDK